MKNKITFINGYARPDRERITRVLGLIPADIVDSKGALPDLCVAERRHPLPRSYNVRVAGHNGWTFDYRDYIGVHPRELEYHGCSARDRTMFATVRFAKNPTSYSFFLRTPGIPTG